MGAVDIAWWRSSEALSEHRDVTHCTPCPSPSQPQGSPSISPPHNGRWRGPCQPFTRTALQQVSGVKWLYETCLVPYPVIMIKSGKVKFVLSSSELKKKYTNKQKNNQQPITKLKLLLWLFFFSFCLNQSKFLRGTIWSYQHTGSSTDLSQSFLQGIPWLRVDTETRAIS